MHLGRKFSGCVTTLLAASLLFTGCQKPVTDESKTPSVPPEDNSREVSTPDPAPDRKDFKTAFRFVVCSDVHISNKTDREAERFKQLFEQSYDYASKQDYKTVDALVVVGDMTNRGEKYECESFMSVVNDNIKPETTFIPVMGNHEHYGGRIPVYTECIDKDLDKHVTVKGYHFIGLSTREQDDYPAESIKWFGEQLAQAAKDDPEKPIITFQHHHIKDTVYVSTEWNTASSVMLDAHMSRYPQVLNFSGHSHGPINNPMSAFQRNYSLFGTGTLTYFEMTSGMSYGTMPPGNHNAAQFYIVEIGENNAVKVMPYNLLTKDFFKTPSQLDDPDEQLIYWVDEPTNPENRPYNKERTKNAKAPFFKEGSKIEFSDISPKSIRITIPQAMDESCMYNYDIVCTSDDGHEVKASYFAEYYYEPMPDKQVYTISGLKPGKKYKVKVTPINVFGKRGEPLTSEFTSGEQIVVPYESKNKVTFKGTFTDFESLEKLHRASTNPSYGRIVNGDVFAGQWCGADSLSDCKVALVDGKGFNGTKALAVSSTLKENRDLYILATDENKNTTDYPGIEYLRIWADFTDVDFRKANFGLVTKSGDLYDTDEADGMDNLKFFYLPDGGDKWQEFTHGGDGCFGTAQGSPVKGKKGWFAFPVKDFLYRTGTGQGTQSAGAAYPDNSAIGIYLFWDYDDSIKAGTEFYFDEIALVEDYTKFDKYENK